jgi:hypothetical protein
VVMSLSSPQILSPVILPLPTLLSLIPSISLSFSSRSQNSAHFQKFKSLFLPRSIPSSQWALSGALPMTTPHTGQLSVSNSLRHMIPGNTDKSPKLIITVLSQGKGLSKYLLSQILSPTSTGPWQNQAKHRIS